MNIRRARVSDIDAISELLSQVLDIHHAGRPDLFKANAVKYEPDELALLICDEAKPVFVAELDGEILGYVFCIIIKHENDNILTDVKTLYIDDLCVDEKVRGKHIGKALYEHAVGYAREIGCYNLTLNVWELNAKARAFYDACGLSVQKTSMEKIL